MAQPFSKRLQLILPISQVRVFETQLKEVLAYATDRQS